MSELRELHDVAEVAVASGGDELAVWAAQGAGGRLGPGVRAWALGESVAVASPGASRRDRIALTGEACDAARLVRYALGECGPAYRPLGDTALIHALGQDPPVAGLEVSGVFAWMSTARVMPGPVEGRWLSPAEYGEVTRLLVEAHPSSYAMPGVARVERWAGIRDAVTGELVAVAADAWSAQEIGLIAGVATAVPARGRGLAERVCRFAAADLAARHGRVALMVDRDNPAAIAVYERLGMTLRMVAAMAVR